MSVSQHLLGKEGRSGAPSYTHAICVSAPGETCNRFGRELRVAGLSFGGFSFVVFKPIPDTA